MKTILDLTAEWELIKWTPNPKVKLLIFDKDDKSEENIT